MLISSGRVTGQFVVGVVDGPDLDDEPDVIPAQGTVTFSAAVPYVPLPGSSPPVTVLTSSIVGVLDAEGFLCTPDVFDPTKAGVRGLRLFANDDPAAPVAGWTWTVTYRFAVVNGATPVIASHSLALMSDTTVDLTTVVKVPSSPGVGVDQAVAMLAQAEASAAQAQAVAQSVRADADAGLFDGPQGAPGNATIRVSTTAGRAAYFTNPGTSTEQLFYGDTGWRDISALLANGWAGTIRIRRTLYDVKLQIVTLTAAAATSGTFLIAPVGFQLGNASIGNVRGFAFNNNTPITMRGVNISGSEAVAITQYSASDTQILGTFEWSSNQPWPTTLPGAAVGTIPAL